MKNRELFLQQAKKIKEFGFTVFIANDEASCYGFVTDGVNIGYFQQDEDPRRIRFSTVHKPCKNWGTGFSVNDPWEGLLNVTKEDVLKAFKTPAFFNGKRVSVIKFASFDKFMKDSWHSRSLVELN